MMSTLFVFPDVAVASLLYAAVYIVTVTSSSLNKTPLQVIGKSKRVYFCVTLKFCFSKFITRKTLTYCKSVKNRLM